MTVLSRGARVRRGGRRPGWPLLTALLVLAIGASSALVFTNRVELLKLAVILALWAAVAAAFVSVIYRRQSDVDQARARDLKLVYDLQLDREISARREYELTVESQLRRELATELRSQAADEVAALRAELAALRTNLEILFDTDLDHRPALETERGPVRAYSDWGRDTDDTPANRVSSSRVVAADSSAPRTDQNPIIDVPEVPAGFAAGGYPAAAYATAEAYEQPDSGSHRRRTDAADGWGPEANWSPQPRREPYPPPPPPPPPASEPPRPEPWPAAQRPPAPAEPAGDWQPVAAEGQWLPPGVPGSNWVSAPAEAAVNEAGFNAANGSDTTLSTPPAGGGRRRRAEPPEPTPTGATQEFPRVAAAPGGPETDRGYAGEGRRARHSTESEDTGQGRVPPAAAPAPRHRSDDAAPETTGPPTGGQSVADLLARLQAGQAAAGGRRRRREE